MVPRSNKFACKLAAEKCTRRFIFRRGCPWFRAVATFLHSKNSPSANVHGCTFVDDVSASSIFKSAGAYKLSSGYQFLPFIGRVFSVSEAAWMPLVPRRNKFALQTCSSRMYTDVHS